MDAKRNISMLLRYPQAIPPLLSNVKRTVTVRGDCRRDDGHSGNPKGISLTITKLCNLNCSMCHYAYSARDDVKINEVTRGGKNNMDVEMVEKLVSEWTGPKPYIAITGGEPTVHPQLIEIVRTIKDAGFTCMLVSNGAKLAKRAEELVDAGVDVVSVSIDGDRETHDKIRGVPGTYDRAVEAMRAVIAAREKAGKMRPLVFINSVMSNGSVENLESLVSLANDVDANGINFQHLWLQTDEMVCAHNELVPELPMQDVYDLDIDAHVDDVDALVTKLSEVKKDHRFVNVFPALSAEKVRTYYAEPMEPVWGDEPSRCAWLYAIIQPDGRITQCKEHDMGSLADSTFQEVWNGEKFRGFRGTIKKHGTFPICVRCCQYFKEW